MDLLTNVQVFDVEEYTVISFGNEIGKIHLALLDEAKSIISDLFMKEDNPLRSGILDIYNFIGDRVDKIEVYNMIEGSYVARVLTNKGHVFENVNLDYFVPEILTFMPELLVDEDLLDIKDYEVISKNNVRLSDLCPKEKNNDIKFIEKDFQKFEVKDVYRIKNNEFSVYSVKFSNGEHSLNELYPSFFNKRAMKPIIKKYDNLLLEDFAEYNFINSFDILDYCSKKNKTRIEKVYTLCVPVFNENKGLEIMTPLRTYFIELKKGRKTKKFLASSDIALSAALQLQEMYVPMPKKITERGSRYVGIEGYV